jgi:all-trans-8'-apo-beta-carotenal 15,15'-oxygenase
LFTRRDSIQLIGAAAPVVALAGCTTRPAEAAAVTPLLPASRQWLGKLTQSMTEEVDYAPEVEGALPEGLSGVLYRNGPGLFDRNGFRKRNLLDGDGMIRATSFEGGRVRFRNHFVRTTKYEAEQKAGAFLYPTWTTPAPGFFENFPCVPSHSQAGILPVVKDGVLYAFDEVGVPWALDPAQLGGEREHDPYEGAPGTGPANYKAHTKTDGRTGDWVLVGDRGRRAPQLHVMVKTRDGRQARHVAFASPRGSDYFHDYFWADPYVVFHLHPAPLSPLPMLAGLRPFADCLDWKPAQGGLIYVVDTSGAQAPVAMEVPSVWMWHALNAYASGDVITADFVGYDAPDHFLGPDAAFRTIMQGRSGLAKSRGMLRRFTVDLAARRTRLETVSAGHYEFPVIPQPRVGQRHRYGYVAAQAVDQGWFHDGIARIDTEGGQSAAFHFGAGHYVGEPVFVPDPARPIDPAADADHGWLIAEVLDGRSGTTSLAVFDAERIADGPLAQVRLRHALPFSFHGWWEAA